MVESPWPNLPVGKTLNAIEYLVLSDLFFRIECCNKLGKIKSVLFTGSTFQMSELNAFHSSVSKDQFEVSGLWKQIPSVAWG